jgi:acyl-CoA thioesterase FadM
LIDEFIKVTPYYLTDDPVYNIYLKVKTLPQDYIYFPMIFHTLRIFTQYVLRYKETIPKTSPVKLQFRCWPTDLDGYLHMNNAQYLRCAEYARWRLTFMANAHKSKVLFIIAENHVNYYRPINPFQTYIISTTMTSTDDKWLHYKHTFKHPTNDDIIYAVVKAKAVLKESNGKTVPVSQLLAGNEIFASWHQKAVDKDNST